MYNIANKQIYPLAMKGGAMEILKDQNKIKMIHEFMMKLEDKNQSLSKTEIYRKYESVISEVEPIDIFYLPMYQNNTGFTIEKIKDSAGRFVNVFYHSLVKHAPTKYEDSFFTYLLKESEMIEKHLNSVKKDFKNENILDNKNNLIKTFEKCLEIERKFLKHEMILYPLLEQRLPTTKPLEVLWSLHDDARDMLKKLLNLLRSDNAKKQELIQLIGSYYYLIYGINTKEKLILLPVASKLLTNDEKEQMYSESIEYGYVFIDAIPKPKKRIHTENIIDGLIQTETGLLSIKQFQGIMQYIPIDITFVDEFDKVIYFNDRKERHFPRNPSIIGRLVKHCHPPKSVAVVERIVDAFKKGEKDKAEFWINFNNSFIYITYYAVRSKHGKYLGTLEVSQDVTHIRNLKGQKHLLDWE
jgi:DUF438 domain-containing protein